VANSLKFFRSGAVGFIEWLDLAAFQRPGAPERWSPWLPEFRAVEETKRKRYPYAECEGRQDFHFKKRDRTEAVSIENKERIHAAGNHGGDSGADGNVTQPARTATILARPR
jgi:hypothetical protein